MKEYCYADDFDKVMKLANEGWEILYHFEDGTPMNFVDSLRFILCREKPKHFVHGGFVPLLKHKGKLYIKLSDVEAFEILQKRQVDSFEKDLLHSQKQYVKDIKILEKAAEDKG